MSLKFGFVIILVSMQIEAGKLSKDVWRFFQGVYFFVEVCPHRLLASFRQLILTLFFIITG